MSISLSVCVSVHRSGGKCIVAQWLIGVLSGVLRDRCIRSGWLSSKGKGHVLGWIWGIPL